MASSYTQNNIWSPCTIANQGLHPDLCHLRTDKTTDAWAHPKRFWLNWRGVGPGYWFLLKSSSVILTCSQSWEPLPTGSGPGYLSDLIRITVTTAHSSRLGLSAVPWARQAWSHLRGFASLDAVTSDTSCLEFSKTSQVKGMALHKAALTSTAVSSGVPRMPTLLTNWLQIQWSHYSFRFEEKSQNSGKQLWLQFIIATNKQTNRVQPKEKRAGSGRSQMQNFCVLSLRSPDALTAQHTTSNDTHRMLLTRDVHSSFLVLDFYWDFIM